MEQQHLNIRGAAAIAIARARRKDEEQRQHNRARKLHEATEALRSTLKSWLRLDIEDPITTRELDNGDVFAYVTLDGVTLGHIERAHSRSGTGPSVWTPCDACGVELAYVGSAQGWETLGETLEKPTDGIRCYECLSRAHEEREAAEKPAPAPQPLIVTPVQHRFVRALIDMIESHCPSE